MKMKKQIVVKNEKSTHKYRDSILRAICQKAIEIAKNLLKINIPDTEVAAAAGISITKIQNLKVEIITKR